MADCPDKSVLIAYLYGEDSAGERARVEAHVAACRACSDELASLRSVQGALSSWTVPEVDLAVDRWQAAPARPADPLDAARPHGSFWSGWSLSPAWGLGIAATVCLAVGAAAAAIAGFEVRYGGFVFSVGQPASPEGIAPRFTEPVTEMAVTSEAVAMPTAGYRVRAAPRLVRRDADIVLASPDAFGSGLEFALVGGAPLPPGDPAAMLERLTVFTPESSAALLEEIRRRMAEHEPAPEPAWPDIVQRLRRAQERNPTRVREDFADFVVRVAGPPADPRPAAGGR